MHESSFLPRIDPRKIWQHESQDFTPWLAENLMYLSTLLDMDLELESTFIL